MDLRVIELIIIIVALIVLDVTILLRYKQERKNCIDIYSKGIQLGWEKQRIKDLIEFRTMIDKRIEDIAEFKSANFYRKEEIDKVLSELNTLRKWIDIQLNNFGDRK